MDAFKLYRHIIKVEVSFGTFSFQEEEKNTAILNSRKQRATVILCWKNQEFEAIAPINSLYISVCIVLFIVERNNR